MSPKSRGNRRKSSGERFFLKRKRLGGKGGITGLLIRTPSNCHLCALELENKFSDIACDEFVCMPHHFIVATVGADLCVRPDSEGNDHHDSYGQRHIARWVDTWPEGQTHRSAPTTSTTMVTITTMGEHAGLPSTVWGQWVKPMTIIGYNREVNEP
jgi:hypothetical protein